MARGSTLPGRRAAAACRSPAAGRWRRHGAPPLGAFGRPRRGDRFDPRHRLGSRLLALSLLRRLRAHCPVRDRASVRPGGGAGRMHIAGARRERGGGVGGQEILRRRRHAARCRRGHLRRPTLFLRSPASSPLALRAPNPQEENDNAEIPDHARSHNGPRLGPWNPGSDGSQETGRADHRAGRAG